MDFSAFFTDNNNFQSWGAEHFFTLLTFTLLGTGIILWARRQSERIQHLAGHSIAAVLSLTIIVWTACRLYLGVFNLQEDLPLLICNLLALLMPVFTLTRHPLLFQVMYFWVFSATLQASLSPHLYNSFPHYNFLKFWLVHCGLLIMLAYAVFVYGMKPQWKRVWTAFLVLQPYVLFCMLVNYLIGANYLYLNAKPDTASLLDLMGPWPVYVVAGELMALPFFAFAYLPVFLADKWRAARGK